MKCPKCGYLGFEEADRCRNCGYEFLLAESSVGEISPELPIRMAAPMVDPLADLAMVDAAAAPRRVSGCGSTPGELPLFRPSEIDGEQYGRRTTPPRKKTSAIERNRRSVRQLPIEAAQETVDDVRPYSLDFDGEMQAVLESEPDLEVRTTPDIGSAGLAAFDWSEIEEASARHADPATAPSWQACPTDDAAPLASRLLAVAIDLLIVAAVDAAVIYFTLEICGMTFADLDLLPKGPLIAFLLVQNGGYLVAFTAGGQTLGKMLTGIRVVGAGGESPLDFGRAALRTGVWLLLAVPAGLGFLTALLRSDHRGLHDRFAQTRVVRG